MPLPPHTLTDRGELSVFGIWTLTQELLAFCEQHRYAPWRSFGERSGESEIADWHRRFLAALSAWHDIPVWAERIAVENRKHLSICLSEGEYRCQELCLSAPFRDFHDFTVNPRPPRPHVSMPWQPVPLGELMAFHAGIDALFSRLDEKSVAPYVPDDLLSPQALKDSTMVWAWEGGDIYPTALLCCDLPGHPQGPAGEWPLLIPAAWGKLDSHWFGRLHLHQHHTLIVANDQGLHGVVRLQSTADQAPRVVGTWVQSCVWPYLAGDHHSCSHLLEAAQHLDPDTRGEVLCDLIDPLTGHRANPPGVKILAGTLHRDGPIAINEAGAGRYPRVVGRLNPRGILYGGQGECDGDLAPLAWGLDDLRWAEIRATQQHMTAVRCPESGLWGYLGRTGELCIAPRFATARAFEYGTAVVWPVDSPDRCGLIDRDGQWVLPPKWQRLFRDSERLIVAQTSDDHWGGLNRQGLVVVPFAPLAAWLGHPEIQDEIAELADRVSDWPIDQEAKTREIVAGGIAIVWKREFRTQARQRLEQSHSSLAAMAGLFDADTTERDLRATGVWGLGVRVLAGHGETSPRAEAGETGRIGAYYPVGLSCFDLSVEAPVHSLPSRPDAVIGISWENLELFENPTDQDCS